MPESYFDKDKGPAYDRFVADFNEGRAAIAERESRMAQRPASAKDYQPVLPKDFLKEGQTFEVAADDPVLAEAREFAYEMGLTQDQFSKLLSFKAKADLGFEENYLAGQKAELEKLGQNGPARIDAIMTWVKALTGKTDPAIGKIAGVSAELVEEFEKIMAGRAGFTQSHRQTQTEADDVKARWPTMSRREQLEYSRRQEQAQMQNRGAR